jgi:hypothetical protein
MKKSKQLKRNEAEARNAAWAGMSDNAKLASMHRRGHAHCKQAMLLAERICRAAAQRAEESRAVK